MAVRRIVANIATGEVAAAKTFYSDLLGLDVLMDFGWIMTFGAQTDAPVLISVASEGGSGTEVPGLSIEVDDVDAVHDRAVELGHPIVYPLTDEPWGVRRFYLHDPFGTLVNILSHAD